MLAESNIASFDGSSQKNDQSSFERRADPHDTATIRDSPSCFPTNSINIPTSYISSPSISESV